MKRYILIILIAFESLLITALLGGILTGCDYEDSKVQNPPPPAGNDSLLLAIDSIEVSGLPYYADTILNPHYNFFGADSVKILFNVISTNDSNWCRLVFSQLDNFNNRLIPFICGHIYGQCDALVIFNFNPSWNNFSWWLWFNVNANSTLKFKNIRVYNARG